MTKGVSFPVFLALVAIAAGFVWYSTLRMPVLVASHFVASGVANGFTSRERYLALMMGVTILLPLLVTLPLSIGLNNPKLKIDLPHRDYWLAPERREETIAFVRQQMMRFAIEEARAKGARLVQLMSNGKRLDAHRFYERLGFAKSHAGFKMRLR